MLWLREFVCVRQIELLDIIVSGAFDASDLSMQLFQALLCCEFPCVGHLGLAITIASAAFAYEFTCVGDLMVVR